MMTEVDQGLKFEKSDEMRSQNQQNNKMERNNTAEMTDHEMWSWLDLVNVETDVENTLEEEEEKKKKYVMSIHQKWAWLGNHKKNHIRELTLREVEIKEWMFELRRQHFVFRDKLAKMRKKLDDGPLGSVQFRVLIDKHWLLAATYYDDMYERMGWNSQFLQEDEEMDDVMARRYTPDGIAKGFAYTREKIQLYKKYLKVIREHVKELIGEVDLTEDDDEDDEEDQSASRSVLAMN